VMALCSGPSLYKPSRSPTAALEWKVGSCNYDCSHIRFSKISHNWDAVLCRLELISLFVQKARASSSGTLPCVFTSVCYFGLSSWSPWNRVQAQVPMYTTDGTVFFLVGFLLFIVCWLLKEFSVQYWMDPWGPLRQKVQSKERQKWVTKKTAVLGRRAKLFMVCTGARWVGVCLC
jgi:hypothetical protein